VVGGAGAGGAQGRLLQCPAQHRGALAGEMAAGAAAVRLGDGDVQAAEADRCAGRQEGGSGMGELDPRLINDLPQAARDPDRALRPLGRSLGEHYQYWPPATPEQLAGVAPVRTRGNSSVAVEELLTGLLPPRRLRAFPRAVKRKMSNYQLKRAQHRSWPQPTMRPAQAVGVLPQPYLAQAAKAPNRMASRLAP
jgi:hypothetical protein